MDLAALWDWDPYLMALLQGLLVGVGKSLGEMVLTKISEALRDRKGQS